MSELNEQAISQYAETIRNLFKTRQFEQRWLIVTPFTRPDGEYIELELVPQNGGKVRLTDNCSTVDYLFTSGVDVEAVDFKLLLSLITRGFGIETSEEEVYKVASMDSIGHDLHKMLNAILGVSFLAYRRRLLQPRQLRARKRFPTLVRDSLNKMKEIAYKSETIKGKLILHSVPFCVSRNEERESLVWPLTAESQNEALERAMMLCFRWIDIKEGGNRYRKIAVVDDGGPKKPTYWENGPMQILNEFSDKVVLWSRRETLEEVLRDVEK